MSSETGRGQQGLDVACPQSAAGVGSTSGGAWRNMGTE